MKNLIIPFSLIFLLSSLAVIGPYPLFEKKIGAKNPWQVFTLMSFVGVALFFFLTMGERFEGSHLRRFSPHSPCPVGSSTAWQTSCISRMPYMHLTPMCTVSSGNAHFTLRFFSLHSCIMPCWAGSRPAMPVEYKE